MKVIIIAEAGVNHNGNIDLAKRLIDVAVAAKVNYVKFQTWKSENVISRFAPKAPYQKLNTSTEGSMLEMEKELELTFEDFVLLKEYSKKSGIGFISTPFDIESIKFLKELKLEIVKIPSGEITNLPYLEEIARASWEIILSTGMCKISEIEAAINILGNRNKLTLLHCNSQYPTPYNDVNLRAMNQLANIFKLPIGLSDHTLGVEVPIAAVAMGAKVIEKHFTLSRDMQGPDHKASLEPFELNQMVQAIRNIEEAMGFGEKRVTDSERENIVVARKSIVAKTTISKGDVLSVDNLTTKRPATGISPMRWYEILGSKALRDFKEDELIEV
ncbi:MAG: N-acetylneuraminate synthase [Peptostreptococcales bacterium]